MGVTPSTVWPNDIKPSVGDIARSRDVGRSGRSIHIWDACPACGFERWIKRNTKGNLCISCATRISASGKRNARWNGGKRHAKNGIFLTLKPNDPFFPMAIKVGTTYQVAEHRLVVAKSIGRCLKPEEVVHHIDRNNRNNDISNLLLLNSSIEHLPFTRLQIRIEELEKRVTVLEAENVLLSSLLLGNPELNGGI